MTDSKQPETDTTSVPGDEAPKAPEAPAPGSTTTTTTTTEASGK